MNLRVKLLDFLDAVALIDEVPQPYLYLIVLFLKLLADIFLNLRELVVPGLFKAVISFIKRFFDDPCYHCVIKVRTIDFLISSLTKV